MKASSSSFRHGRWATRERGKEGALGAEGVGGADRIGEEEDAIGLGGFGSIHTNLTLEIWVIHCGCGTAPPPNFNTLFWLAWLFVYSSTSF